MAPREDIGLETIKQALKENKKRKEHFFTLCIIFH